MIGARVQKIIDSYRADGEDRLAGELEAAAIQDNHDAYHDASWDLECDICQKEMEENL